MGNDPLGLTPQQRAESNRSVVTEGFVRRFGDVVRLAEDGTWYVERGGVRYAVPHLPHWPDETVGDSAGITLNEAIRIARQDSRDAAIDDMRT